MKLWQKYVTGTPEANARFAAAQDELEAYASVHGASWDDETFVSLNTATTLAHQELPALRRRAWALVMKRWLWRHVTGTPEANGRLEAAMLALESYYDATGRDDDAEFWRLNGLVHEAMADVPAPRRYGWI